MQAIIKIIVEAIKAIIRQIAVRKKYKAWRLTYETKRQHRIDRANYFKSVDELVLRQKKSGDNSNAGAGVSTGSDPEKLL